MGVAWTKEQTQVIKLRNRSLLVSAAAGSGKTAVLVERIIQMVCDAEHPVDIDKLLVVTFTNAAAAEMKERIEAALEKRLLEEPDREHLQKQMTLIHHAKITTIDSFCMSVVKEHFHEIRLDPEFRIGDSGELTLLGQEAANQVFEEAYEQNNESFLRFVDSYGKPRSDKNLVEMMRRFYDFSISHPWPIKWLKECKALYAVDTEQELKKQPWIQWITKEASIIISELCKQYRQLCTICEEEDGPNAYVPVFLQDLESMERIAGCEDYEGFYEQMRTIKFGRLPVAKGDMLDADKREFVKEQRNQIKKEWESIQKAYFPVTIQGVLSQMQTVKPIVEVLVDLTLRFFEVYGEKKREKKLADFSDIEHFALQILLTEDGQPTDTAKEYSRYFEEIMIDEYQDSNLVQEFLLNSVSRKSMGRKNMFMVGDVKQSIYKFRMARPELFMEKYDTYSTQESSTQRIDLHKNFRSRSQVLESINYLFYGLMHKDLGNVEYDEAAALYTGASYTPEKGAAYKTRAVILEPDEETDNEYTDLEMEAKAVAEEIHRVREELQVSFGDIVVVLRTMNRWAETFAAILTEEGIPAHTESKSGYFSALEIRTTLNYLLILDNPLQDIPFTAVLTSPIGGFRAQELAYIRAGHQKQKMYDCCVQYMLHAEDDPLADRNITAKLHKFFEQYKQLRELLPFTPIHRLLSVLWEKTGYEDYVSAMPGGTQRKANMQMLMEKAIAFEQTSYRGLFHFVRYIENLEKYQVDFGEAGVEGAAEDAVRIMSIHKSKGLEFPVVIVAGMGKNFNKQDTKAAAVFHEDMGIGLDAVAYDRRIKAPTLLKSVMKRQQLLDNLGEELRVLYVALTRAKEKLILIGKYKDFEKKAEKWECGVAEPCLTYRQRSQADCYYDWILPLVCRKEAEELFEVQRVSYESLLTVTAIDTQEEIWEKEQLMERLREQPDTGILDAMKQELNWQYPYEAAVHMKTKVSVSELKKDGGVPEDEAESLIKEEEIIPLIPDFMEEKEETIQPSERGTAYHRVMECLDFEKTGSLEAIKEQLSEFYETGLVDVRYRRVIRADFVYALCNSTLGARLRRAQEKGVLRKEQQFVIGVSADDTGQKCNGEMVMLQGVMDAFFEEGDGFVLVDYKTDYVKEKAELEKRYTKQLELYAKALEQMTGRPVKEKLIYSFTLQETLTI